MRCIISYPDLTLFYLGRGRSEYEIMRCIQLRDILDALKENSEWDSWIQELHRKSRKKKVFENALDTKNRTMILRNL